MITTKKIKQHATNHRSTTRPTPAGRHKAAPRVHTLSPEYRAYRLACRKSVSANSSAPQRPAYPACDALNPLRRYEQKILALVARIERRPAISAAEPFTYKEARAIYKYHKLAAFFPVAGFADRLNTVAAPAAMTARDLSDVFRRPFPRPSAPSLKEAARIQRENERHRINNLTSAYIAHTNKGRTNK